MNAELQLIAEKLAQAASPEEVFGELSGDAVEKQNTLKALYRRLAKVAHPDIYPPGEDRMLAQQAFSRLAKWFTSAEAKLRSGSYGLHAGAHSVMVETGKYTYTLEGGYTQAIVYNRYPCTFRKMGRTRNADIKIVRDPEDNDLAQNEARILGILRSGKAAHRFGPYLPQLTDSFLYSQDGMDHQASVFERKLGWYTLEEVRRAYPGGIDPKDMAWMFRRLLVALGFLHLNGVIHGAVLPPNISILPEEHGLMLEEYSFAVLTTGSDADCISVIDPAYEDWYPLEVQRKETPLPGTDIGMAARCMMFVMGADPLGSAWPESVPGFLRSFFKGSTLPGKKARPQDAWALKEEFDQLLQQHWGPRKFHPFTMNTA